MKNILPLLFSTLFFLTPLRLVAMEDVKEDTQQESESYRKKQTQSNTRKARIEAAKTQPQENAWGTSTYGSTTVIEEKDNDETDSPLYAETSADPQPQATTSQREFTVEDFRNLILRNPHLQNYVLRSGYLVPDRMVLASQEEISNIWHIFFAAIEKEYGNEGKNLARQIQSAFVPIGKTGKILYPALSSEKIQSYLYELDSKKQPPSEENIIFNHDHRLPDVILARAQNIDDIAYWPSSWKINYNGTGYDATVSSELGLRPAVEAVLRRNKEERRLNRRTLDAITKELIRPDGVYSSRSASFQERFALRWILGQPLTAGAYKEWSASRRDYSFPFSGAAADAMRGLARIRTNPSSSHDYVPIPDPHRPVYISSNVHNTAFYQSGSSIKRQDYNRGSRLQRTSVTSPETRSGTLSILSQTFGPLFSRTSFSSAVKEGDDD